MGRRTLETLVAAFPLIAALLAFHFVAEGRWLYLPAKGTKCVSEEIHDNVVVLAVYFVVSDGHSHDPTLSVKGENVTHGQFAFTSDEAGNYEACFWVDSQYQESEVIVNLDWKIGIAAKDWESVAKKEKIKGVDLALRKLGGVVEDIHENLLYLRSREADMRIVSEKTNARVAWFSIMSLGCLHCSLRSSAVELKAILPKQEAYINLYR